MSSPQETLQDKLAALRKVYAEQLPAKLADVEAAWLAASNGSGGGAGLAVLHRLLHGLTGSGATFGFAALSDAARVAEIAAKALLEHEQPPSPEQLHQLGAHLAALKGAATQPEQIPAAIADVQPLAGRALLAQSDSRLLYLVENDVALGSDLALQIGFFGYTARVFTQPSQLAEAVAAAMPAAILMDVAFPEGGLAGPAAIAALPQDAMRRVPVVFLSARDDLAARLQAVRAGGSAYFTKPVDVAALIDKLDVLTSVQAPEPYRVLIVDDSPTLAAFYAATLQHAGIEARTVTDPLQVMGPLAEFSPDLILLDMYMPDCTGAELAKVMRQQEAYVGIPIVYLSAETDMGRQLAAMQLGGDDFLTKPIQPEHLVSAVASRARRYHALRALMVRDSLTGLLNHTTIKERLENEVLRAQRLGGRFSFAMVDIDHFKSVNDTYGHPVGDRVIKSISRMLQQRLRQTDIIGRYGGEEFAVILPDTEGAVAAKILDEMRDAFGKIRQHACDAEFSVTFSCGVATYPEFSNAAQLNNAADRMLYEAKHRGRNCVVLAQAGESGD